MAPKPVALFPNHAHIRQLIQAGLSAELIAEAVISDQREKYRYALVIGLCATISFIALLAAFTYLVMNNHDKAAGAVLGAGVLAIVRTMLGQRL